VTRIIAGFAGSLQLAVPKFGTRPTSDRVREAIFSALDARGLLNGARVLDLYSGSGALGLEAASRGASSVTLVDRANAASKIGSENAARVRRAAPRDAVPDIVVSSQPAQSFIGGSLAEWDVVFLDPPYELGGLELVHNLEALVPRLAPDAVVVVERAARDREPTWPDGLSRDRRTTYGDTAVYWLSPDPNARATPLVEQPRATPPLE
jgi:16S rRNA (guanine966-N2)-methyltransferase